MPNGKPWITWLEAASEELADFMEALGCVDALDLDGGDSSTFVYQSQVIDHLSGDYKTQDHQICLLRPISNAILILQK